MILLQESLGAQVIEHSVANHFLQMWISSQKEGWLFENLCNRHRFNRGMEATTAGVLRHNASSCRVKLNNAQSGFFTIADLLHKQGYNTSFIYGDESTRQ